MKLQYFFLILALFLIPLVQGSLGTFKAGDCVEIRTILNSTSVNISSISYPNSTIIITNQAMTKNGLTFNYTFCNTLPLGNYVYDYYDDAGNVYVNDFDITYNGKDAAGTGIIVLFIIFFLVVMGFLVYSLITSIGHLANLDFDVIDLSKSLGLYFVIFSLYMLSKFYLGSADIEGFLLLFIEVGAFTHVMVPLIAFILSITIGSLKKKRFDIGLPANRRTRV